MLLNKKMSGERLFLGTNNFQLQGKLLKLKYNGFCVNLFYSKQCQYCGPFWSILQRLPEIVPGCTFGFTNIDKNPDLPRMSAETTTRIEHVPYIVFYAQGIPISEYQGPADIENLKHWIIEEANNSQTKLQGGQKMISRKKPDYCYGNPKECERDNKKCYTSLGAAYGKGLGTA